MPNPRYNKQVGHSQKAPSSKTMAEKGEPLVAEIVFRAPAWPGLPGKASKWPTKDKSTKVQTYAVEEGLG